jgi:propanol-preferring alcohol dehydrogenase
VKAAVLLQFREPLEVRELPDPTPGPGDAVIRVEACGICRSDWHAWQGDWTWAGVQLNLPRVLGHEFGGVVEAVGEQVRNFKPGDRVTVPFHLACGRCEYCYSGRSNICLAYGAIGFHHDGGYGKLVLVPNADVNLVRLPDNVDFATAAALGCRYMTAYHALADRALVRAGEWVAVFGVGGVGLSAVQIASGLGARVVAVDISDEKLRLARAEGAVETVNATGGDVVKRIKQITGGGVHVSVDALGSVNTALPSVLSVRKGGRHVQVGLTGQQEKGMVPVPVDAMVFQEVSFIPSFGCPVTSYPGLLSLVSAGKLDPRRLVTRTVRIEDATSVLQAMTEFGTTGFTVITQW